MNNIGRGSHPVHTLRGRARFAAFLLFAFTAGAAAQTVTFIGSDYGSVSAARAIVSADFNRDGTPDLAQASRGRNTITILLNNHREGFVRGVDVAVGAGPFAMATADFNGDAVPDLAVANADGNSISVLLGNGDGSFRRSDIAADAQNPRGLAAGDVNNDGRLDLIYSAYATGAVQVLIGDGAGRFTKGMTYVSAALNPQGLATADFNHDGHLDVAVAYTSATGLRILYGNGGTAFAARTVSGEAHLNVLETGDFNHDGWMDVAAASTPNSAVTVYEGTSTGLVRVQRYPVGSSPRGIVVTDLNDDGLLDIATANRGSNTVSVLLNDRAHPGSFLPESEIAADVGSRAVAAADFDGDGLADLATANEYASRTTVLTNRTLLDRAAYAFRATSRETGNDCCWLPDVLSAADFNRDGKVDIATIDATLNGISLLFADGPTVGMPTIAVRAVRAADVNADGSADLLYVSLGGPSATVGVYIGDGHGHFRRSATTAMMIPFVYPSIAIGDLNRDGRPDLVSVGADGDIRQPVLQLLLGRGDGRFRIASQVTLHAAPDGMTDVVTLADVNRDGRLDVVLRSGQIWLGDGAGGVAAIPVDAGVEIGAMADMNGDGYLDIVSYVGVGGSVLSVSLGRGVGFAPAITTGTPNFGENAFSVGDLDADGHLDVVVASGDLMLGNGDGTFVLGGQFDFGAPLFGSANNLLVVEQSGDGLPDIVTSFEVGQVRVLTNERTSVNTRPTVDAGPDRTIEFVDTAGEDCRAIITAVAADADAHFLSYEWRDATGELVSDLPGVPICTAVPGSRVFSVTVRDGRGGVGTDTVTVTRVLTKEIVVWTADAEDIQGRWTLVADPTAAGGVRAYDPNLGAPKMNAPLVEPGSSVLIRFYPEPTLAYKLWVRLKADGNSWANDSVWLQFRSATDLSGTPKYPWFSTTGLAINLEECLGCGESGWGWEDDGWGAVNRNGVMLRFSAPDNDPEWVLIQTREDGVSIDQIVLSAEKYLTARPGAAKNDATILPSTRRPR